MPASTVHQKQAVAAYLGPEASWTYQAAQQHFGPQVRYLAEKQIGDVFAAVQDARADYGVVPIENSTEGAITQTLDLFIHYDLRISALLLLPVENHLLGRGDRANITRLYSHAQVFGQCRDWLNREMPGVEKVQVSSTTRAAELAAQELNTGALAGKTAAEVYGLPILASAIQDRADNATRFVVLGRESATRSGSDRTLLMLGVREQSGGLLHAMRAFDQAAFDLRKIETRPSRHKAWDYYFFIDVAGHEEDELVVKAMQDLRKDGALVKMLGSYPDAKKVRP